MAHADHLGHIQVPVYADGRLVRARPAFQRDRGETHATWSATNYEYAGERLIAMRSAVREHEVVSPLPALRLTYTEDAELLTITSESSEIGVLYRRRAAGAVTRAIALIREQYPERIAAWAQRVAPDEELACLIIRYPYFDQHPLPPGLAAAPPASCAPAAPPATSGRCCISSTPSTTSTCDFAPIEARHA